MASCQLGRLARLARRSAPGRQVGTFNIQRAIGGPSQALVVLGLALRVDKAIAGLQQGFDDGRHQFAMLIQFEVLDPRNSPLGF